MTGCSDIVLKEGMIRFFSENPDGRYGAVRKCQFIIVRGFYGLHEMRGGDDEEYMGMQAGQIA